MGAINSIPGRCCAIHAAASAKSSPRRSTSPRRLPGRSGNQWRSRRRSATCGERPRRLDHERDQRPPQGGRQTAPAHRAARRNQVRRASAQDGAPGLAGGLMPHAPLAPRPHLRAHVLYGRKSARLQARRKPEIEFRCVDANEHMRPRREESCDVACGAIATGAASAAALP